MYLVLSAFYFLLVIAALVDIITRDESQVQHLPKLMWVFLVIIIPVIGSILWFAVGRDYRPQPEFVRYGDPRRHSAAAETVDVRAQRVSTTEQQLAELDREIEFYEKQAKLKRLQSELDDKAGE
ncbi:phospholipase D-like protein [Frondihabitans sp. PhB188]|uniref:PLD nuclease N-terminal domain-containing protein n=1 Tax=Frondihabitans sp. PhB188 TaxID=2485200 RepID=UPI000F45FE19|nr:PLD nuclease N-terminal domain-containing protein [Frondihabitans sp. PhB188]ROQ39800.1 phospholipase D-like protein [Frondihabitans sp. PhB188]